MFLADQTVVVDKGAHRRGRRGQVKPSVPAGAQVIDGRGKTLLPGLWDCHMHVGDDFTGLQELSMGVTSVRDPGNDDSQTMDRRERAARGELLFPHVYASSLIDGKGTYTAQVANVATSEAEAIALVDKAKANGFIGVKFYGTLEHGLAAGSGRRSAQTRTARARPHSRRHAAAGRDQRRLRRDHAHQLDRDAGDARCGDQGVERHHALRRAGALREGSRPRRHADHGSSFDDGGEGHLQRSDDGGVRGRCTCRRTATCRRPTRRSSARCRRRPSAASAPAASPCRRT